MNQEQDRSDMQKKFKIAQVVFLIISSIGIFGNSVSILALRKSKKLRSPTTAFVITLCTADLLFCILTLTNYSRPDWNCNHVFCILITWAKYFVGGESVYLMIGITINRYICVIHPNYYRLIYRRKCLAFQIALTWMYSFMISLLPFFEIWGKYGYDPNSGLCIILRQNGKSARTFFFISYYALPATVFAVCYSRIFWVTYKTSRQVRKQCNFFVTPEELNATATSPECRIQRGDIPDRVNDKEMKILKVMLVIFVAFLICYFPMALIKFFDSKAKIPALTALSYLGINLSNVINPMIYVAMSAEYRKAYIELFTCKQLWLPLSTSSNAATSSNTATIEMLSV
ncbi:G-protein coupled receptor moody-like [Parasteatoda tepidariorum]|uniref:G-protein coupled receptor moody-like n=1 Tax=Parasteatoda tepidariorum TaxID=114398 RepID=UPI0039BCFF17